MVKIKSFLVHVFSQLEEHNERCIFFLATGLSAFFIAYFYSKGLTLAYGDAESHLNIAKRVIDSVTPGMAQLGGIWLPLPHILMIPFVYQNVLWRTGIGGAIVSGVCYIVSSVFLYKTVFLFTKNKTASTLGAFLFMLNTNILYMQSTPMSELPLIVFFILSLYFFFLYLQDDTKLLWLIAAGFFGFCASLSRYDGWFLVAFEALALIIFYLRTGIKNHVLEGKTILFSTIGFFGVLLWLLWDRLILGDAFYFTNSPFSAKAQQQGWMARGELPGYKNLIESLKYYSVTSFENIGLILTVFAVLGISIFLFDRKQKNKIIITLLLFVPFIFYVATLYLGQSVIFIPDLTPSSYQWTLFNVRYGMMMVPTAAIFFGYLFYKLPKKAEGLLAVALFLQTAIYFTGMQPTLTLEDGTTGLSAAAHPDADRWLSKNYNKGYVLLDDYARTISITSSNIPIQNVIYVGNKPYWDDALKNPEKYVDWVVLQKGDAVWNNIYENPARQANLYKYYAKTYTSPNILIFKRNTTVVAARVLTEK